MMILQIYMKILKLLLKIIIYPKMIKEIEILVIKVKFPYYYNVYNCDNFYLDK